MKFTTGGGGSHKDNYTHFRAIIPIYMQDK